ncbi:unnamed protein product, partial [Ectocarpus sp. 12 AP-2014]
AWRQRRRRGWQGGGGRVADGGEEGEEGAESSGERDSGLGPSRAHSLALVVCLRPLEPQRRRWRGRPQPPPELVEGVSQESHGSHWPPGGPAEAKR